jgi:hypothetical protein
MSKQIQGSCHLTLSSQSPKETPTRNPDAIGAPLIRQPFMFFFFFFFFFFWRGAHEGPFWPALHEAPVTRERGRDEAGVKL